MAGVLITRTLPDFKNKKAGTPPTYYGTANFLVGEMAITSRDLCNGHQQITGIQKSI